MKRIYEILIYAGWIWAAVLTLVLAWKLKCNRGGAKHVEADAEKPT